MATWHNQIKLELIEALQLLKFSFKNKRGLNFTEDLSVEVEIKELEALMEHISSIPGNINAFIASLTNEMSTSQL
jgi:hypothetical protein